MDKLLIGTLIAFCLNNLIWAVFVIYLISIVQNRPLPKILHRKIEEKENEFDEATDDQILSNLHKLQEDIKQNQGFDEHGAKVESSEEKVVE